MSFRRTFGGRRGSSSRATEHATLMNRVSRNCAEKSSKDEETRKRQKGENEQEDERRKIESCDSVGEKMIWKEKRTFEVGVWIVFMIHAIPPMSFN